MRRRSTTALVIHSQQGDPVGQGISQIWTANDLTFRILRRLLTAIVVGPVAYLFAPSKTFRGRLIWAVIIVSATYAMGLAGSIYLGDWLGAD